MKKKLMFYLKEDGKQGKHSKVFLKMKLLALFILVMNLQISASVYSQEARMNIEFKNASLKEVLNTIKQQSDYSFVYSDTDIKNIRNVSIKMENASIEEILNESLKNLDLVYEVFNDVIILRPTDKEAIAPTTIGIEIKGNITDENGIPLPGATIIEEGTLKGITSDIDGNFTIEVTNTSSVLKISYVGFTTQLIPVKNKTFITVVMEETSSSLDEVVITGVFKKRKETYVGALKTISQKELKKYGNRNLLSTLNKIDPSFNIIENNEYGSDPNRLPEINIRGTTSLPTNIKDVQNNVRINKNTPLFILDGFEISLKRMMDLNLSEVESISILKDASATAMYGSRGANGIVVITRKLPKEGKLNIFYSSNIDLEFPDISSYHLLNAREKLDLELKSGYYSDENAYNELYLRKIYYEKLKFVEKGINTDWLSKPLQTGIGQSHNLRFEGGSKEFRYSASLNYNHRAGAMKKSNRKNFNGTLTLVYNHKKISFNNSLSIGLNKSNESPYGSFSTYTRLNPYWDPYNENGKLVKRFGYLYKGVDEKDFIAEKKIAANNPLYNTLLGDENNTADYQDVSNNFSIRWNVLKSLTLESSFGISKNIKNKDNFKPGSHPEFIDEKPDKKGSYEYSTRKDFKYNFRTNLNYLKLFAKKHMLSCGLSFDMSEASSQEAEFSATGYPGKNKLFTKGLKFDQKKPSGNEFFSRSVGITSNLNYNYANRYFAELTYNIDGSSRFGTDEKFSSSWSVGMGWNLHHEKFLKDSEFINRLKITTAYGISGSQDFNPYQAMLMYKYFKETGYENWLGNYIHGIANTELKRQDTHQLNFGIDAKLLNNRITLIVNIYNKTTFGLISSFNTLLSNGFESYQKNIGTVRNTGFETSLQVYLIKNEKNNFYWSVGANLAYNKNKVIKLSEAVKKQNEKMKTSGSKVYPNNLYFEGKPINGLYVVPSLGIDPATGQELFRKKNGEVTRIWNAEDRIYVGVSNPEFNGNLNTDLTYKNFFLSVSFGFHWGGFQYNTTLINRVENADKRFNVDRRVYDDRWMKPGDKTFFKGEKEKGYRINSSKNYSSRFAQKDMVFTCQNIDFSYQLNNNNWLKNNLGIQSLEFGCNIGDIFYISSIKRERGLDYPFSHKITFSIRADF